MKKLFFTSFSVLFAISSISAQSGKVISAYNYMVAYENKEGAGNLVDAAKNADEAATDENTSKATKTWWYRAKIYQYIASESTLKDKYPKASLEAVLSYQNMQKLNEPKFKDWKDAVENMKVLTVNLFNDGVTAYQAKNYKSSYLFFSAISDVAAIVTQRGGEVTQNTLNMALRNAALSAENAKDTSGAIETYKKYLVVAPDSSRAVVYQSLINLYKKAQKIDEAKKLTDEGLAKYPEDKDLIIDKINFFFMDRKQGEALEYLKKLNNQDPKNEVVLYNLGVAYEVLGDSIQARKTYENLLTINPASYDGNYGLGVMIYNKADQVNKKMNALSMSPADQKKFDELKKDRNALFIQAKPFLAKALEAKPGSAEISKTLTTIDALTK